MEILNKLGGAISAITMAGVRADVASITIALPLREATILCYLIEREIRSSQAPDATPFRYEPAKEFTWRGATIKVEVKP